MLGITDQSSITWKLNHRQQVTNRPHCMCVIFELLLIFIIELFHKKPVSSGFLTKTKKPIKSEKISRSLKSKM